MLFYMLSARHLGLAVTPESNTTAFWAVILILWAAIEANAIKGKLGPLQTVKGVITAGFVLSAVVYGIFIALI
jgi:hypothetical protein